MNLAQLEARFSEAATEPSFEQPGITVRKSAINVKIKTVADI